MTLLRGLAAERIALVDDVLWERTVAATPIEAKRIAANLDRVLDQIGGPVIRRYSGAQIHTVRRALGLTMQQLADLLNTSTSSINSWEHGYKIPNPVNQANITRFMDAAKKRLQDAENRRVT